MPTSNQKVAAGSAFDRFNSAVFVDRDELQLVNELVSQLRTGMLSKDAIINYSGVTGVGKTWLLLMLKHEFDFSVTTDTVTAYFSFPETIQPRHHLLNQLMIAIAEAIQEQTGIRIQTQDSEQFVGDLRQIATSGPIPLLLLDDTERIAGNDWAYIEHKIISPLAQHGRIIIALAGRSHIPTWNDFEVRRRVREAHVKELTKAEVQELLDKYGIDIDASLIYPYTAGNPGLIRDIVDFVEGKTSGDAIDRNWLQKHEADLLRVLQDYRQEFIKNVPLELHPYLFAVMPLRYYRSEALAEMSKTIPIEKRLPGSSLSILRKLDSTEVVSWDSGRREYLTDPAGRRILNRTLLLENPKQFASQQSQALDLYKQLANKFTAASDRYILEAWFHLANLYSVTGDREAFLTEFDRWLDFARRELNVDRFEDLTCEVTPSDNGNRADQEIIDLLPNDLLAEIRRKIDKNGVNSTNT